MKEADRLARNTQRLTEMFDPMAPVVRSVLKRMEDQSFVLASSQPGARRKTRCWPSSAERRVSSFG
jgi:hypothetical protein